LRRERARVVVIGGAGAMGRIIARDLAETSRGAVEVVIADRDTRAAEELGLETVETDVGSPRVLARALRGARAVIASLPYRWNSDAMRGALAARCHYLDLGGLFHETRRQLRLGRAFRESGLMAILGVGSAPGITNVLAARAARELERVRAVHCEVGNVDLTRWRAPPLLGFGYSPDTLLDELTLPSAVFRGGRIRFVPPLAPGERVVSRFPEPLGELGLETTLHSELATLPSFFRKRGVEEVTFRQSFERTFLERATFLVALGLGDRERLDGLEVAPRSVLSALLGRLPPAEPLDGRSAHEVLRVVVDGERGGQRVRVTAECRVGPDGGGGTGPDIDTGAPPSIVVQLLLAGEMDARPGVWAPEQVVPCEAFVRELGRRGLSVGVSSQTVKGSQRPSRE
jgi:saccharopine dehydrogenase (NAD+, L-lysine-forming)